MNKEEVLEQFKSKYDEFTIEEHSRKLGVPATTLRGWARKAGLPMKSSIPKVYTSKFDDTLLENGFDGKKWSYGWLKANGASIFIKNPEDAERIEESKKEWLEEIKKHAPKRTPFTYKKIKEGHLLIIDPADVHIGKLSLEEETGEHYNVKKAIERVKQGLEELLQKTSNFPIEKIILVIGNDILHTDTTNRTTTKGTPQDTDGMWFDNYRKAHNLYVECIERLTTIAPVHIVHCPSNHDVMSGFFLAQSIEAYFHKEKNVTFDTTIAHRKYFEYGRNLLGFSHGDGGKETDLMITMAHESNYWKADKNNPQFRYWYLHHQHHMKKISYKDGEDFIGGTIEYLRAVSAGDGWHARNMYLAPQSICAFIHSKDFGQVARITHYFI